MDDQGFVQLVQEIFKWVKAVFVIVACTLGILVMTHWDKTLLHGWRVVRDTPTVQPESTHETPAQDEAPRPVRHRPRRVSVPPPEPEPVVEDQTENDQAAPVVATPIEHIETPAAPLSASPVVVFVPVPEYSLTVTAKKHHRWPRRFFGAIGRGFGKALGLR